MQNLEPLHMIIHERMLPTYVFGMVNIEPHEIDGAHYWKVTAYPTHQATAIRFGFKHNLDNGQWSGGATFIEQSHDQDGIPCWYIVSAYEGRDRYGHKSDASKYKSYGGRTTANGSSKLVLIESEKYDEYQSRMTP